MRLKDFRYEIYRGLISTNRSANYQKTEERSGTFVNQDRLTVTVTCCALSVSQGRNPSKCISLIARWFIVNAGGKMALYLIFV
ncbi:unnamed protein product [Leptidea sinapis]|uniref:Uncharacterized protein n=1 Tax=Leptidea sinapis TaxID=189913 RepID=A0A5E4R5Q3_9NEOP|nr:unnamed protein product [Leptidea sinapis]